jgi:hypothetical protein
MQPDGTYRRVEPQPGDPPMRSQERFLKLAEESAARRSMPVPAPPPSASTPRVVPVVGKPRRRQRTAG